MTPCEGVVSSNPDAVHDNPGPTYAGEVHGGVCACVSPCMHGVFPCTGKEHGGCAVLCIVFPCAGKKCVYM